MYLMFIDLCLLIRVKSTFRLLTTRIVNNKKHVHSPIYLFVCSALRFEYIAKPTVSFIFVVAAGYLGNCNDAVS